MRLLKLGEAAELVRLSPASLRQQILEGRGPDVTRLGTGKSRIMIEEGKLTKWVEHRTIKASDL